MKIYIELTERKSGLTQKGYLCNGASTYKLPFVLTDIELADDFHNSTREANEAVGKLNFGYYSKVEVSFI